MSQHQKQALERRRNAQAVTGHDQVSNDRPQENCGYDAGDEGLTCNMLHELIRLQNVLDILDNKPGEHDNRRQVRLLRWQRRFHERRRNLRIANGVQF